MAFGSIANLFVTVGADIKAFAAGMATVDAKTKQAAASMKRTMLIGSAAVVAGLGYAVHAAADFESSLNTMQAVSHATGQQMKQVSALAKALGADIRLPSTSAADAADAMVQLAKGGLSVDQSMKAVRGTLLLSAAAQIDNAQAATIVADSLNSFGLQGKAAVRVSDLLAASANASTAEITDMAMSLQQSAAVAKMAHFSIEDTVTALSELANAGVKGSDAGTSLKTMILRLIAPIGSAAKEIKALNIQLRDQHGNLKSIPALADEFQRKLSGMTQAQKDAAMAAIFGSDAIRAGNIILGQGSAKFEELKNKVTETGAAQRLADAKMKGFNGALEGFKSAVETAAISIGTALLPSLTQGVHGVSEFISQLGDSSGFKDALTSIGTVASTSMSMLGSAMSAVLPVVGQVGSALNAVGGTAAGPMVIGMAAAATAAYYLVKAFNAVKASLISMVSFLKANPWAAFLIGASLVLGAIVGLTAGTNRSKDAVDRLAQAMRDASAAAAQLAQQTGRLRDADLDHKQAVLNLKQALLDRKNVQSQVAAGSLKGADAERALEQANLNVARAGREVQRTEDDKTKAIQGTIKASDAQTNAILRSVGAAARQVENMKLAVRIMPGSEKAAQGLAAAQDKLNKVVATGATRLGISADKLRSVAGNAGPAAGKIKELASESDQWSGKLTTFGKALQRVATAAPQAGQAAQGIGTSISQGIATGLRNSATVATTAAAAVARQAVAAAKAEIKSKSPSKVAADEIGLPFSQGIAQGILDGGPDIVGAVGNIAQLMVQQTKLAASMQRSQDAQDAMARKQAVKDAELALAEARKGVQGETAAQHRQAVTQAERQLQDAQFAVQQAGQQKRLTALQTAIAKQQAVVDAAKTSLSNAFTRMSNAAFQAFDDATQVGGDKIRASYDSIFSDLDQQASAAADSLQARFDSMRSAITGQQNALTPAEAMIKALQDNKAALDRAVAIQDAQQQLVEAQASGDPEQIKSAVRALDNAQLDQRLADLQVQADAERAAKDKQAADALAALDTQQKSEQSALDTAFATRRTTIQTQMDDELRIYETARGIERDNMETHLAALQAQYERGKTNAATAQAGILAVLRANGIDFLNAGQRLGDLFAQGLKNSVDTVGNAAGKVATAAQAYLKLHSPAEKGPLSDLDKWWNNFAPTLTQGIDMAPVSAAATDMASASRTGGAAAASGMSNTYIIHVHSDGLTDPAKVSSTVIKSIDEFERRNGQRYARA